MKAMELLLNPVAARPVEAVAEWIFPYTNSYGSIPFDSHETRS